MSEEFQDKVEQILGQVKSKSSETTLFLNFIPPDIKKEFVDLAHAEFGGHYGFTIKWLMDFRKGLLANPNEQFMEVIETLTQKVLQLENAVAQTKQFEDSGGIKTLSGKVIRTGGNGNGK